MKTIFFILLLCCSFTSLNAQTVVPEDSVKAPQDAGNVYVHRIAGDSLVTSFIIIIKENVALHKHETHSEHVYVIEGTGTMLLNGTTIYIKEGDVIFIPKGTWHAVTVTSTIPLKVLSIQAPEFDGKDRIIYKNQ
jgi:mannose-6-phosphate isomerase-like protein (cupin superfamily)